MSIRTIIEINHDHLSSLSTERLHEVVGFLRALMAARDPYEPQGIRVLGQRHNSETLTLEIE